MRISRMEFKSEILLNHCPSFGHIIVSFFHLCKEWNTVIDIYFEDMPDCFLKSVFFMHNCLIKDT